LENAPDVKKVVETLNARSGSAVKIRDSGHVPNAQQHPVNY